MGKLYNSYPEALAANTECQFTLPFTLPPFPPSFPFPPPFPFFDFDFKPPSIPFWCPLD